ncbi:MAG: phosphatidylserine decarboxylase, partial [Elusimicrobiota bacterium]
YHLRIAMRYSDVHVQRIPLPGVVRSVREVGAGYRYPDDLKHLDNVSVVTEIDSPLGVYELRQITTLFTRRIKNTLRPGQRVALGEKFGNILLGSTVLLSLPRRGVTLSAKQYQKIYAGETILARFS